MIRITFFDDTKYTFALKNKEREMEFCIDLAQQDVRNEPKRYRVTSTEGVVRVIDSATVKKHEYIKSSYVNINEREGVKV